MVGFNSNNHSPAIKLESLPKPLHTLPDLFLSTLDPLPDFDFMDDWLLDNSDTMSRVQEEEEVGIESQVKTLDFDDNKDVGLVGSLIIEQEMAQVSLLGDGGEEVASSLKPLHYEILGELEAMEHGGEEEEDGHIETISKRRLVVGVEDIELKPKGDEKNVVSDGEDSSSDSESETESQSDSSSSSSSSSSDEEEEGEKDVVDGAEVEEGEIKDFDPEEILIGSDEDEPVKGPIKSKNEIEFLPPVPLVNVTLEPHHQTLPVGVILSIMEAKVVVEGLEKHNPLNEGSILWITETRSPLGIVDEIFGPVKNPYYIVRHNSAQEVPDGICQGTSVSFVADFADHILNDKNLYKKGYDASGENDEEISDEVEFSDDEKEAEYRRAQKMATKGRNDKKRGDRDFVAQKKVQHKGPWKNTQSPTQIFGGPDTQTNSANQSHASPVETSFGSGSCAYSSSAGPPIAGVTSLAQPASQIVQANCFMPQNLVPVNGGWTNGMAGQPQQHMGFPHGFPMNGMPIQPLNLYQQPPQMFSGFPNGMPFQQQFDPRQSMMHNVALPYAQPIFSPGPSPSWSGHMGQPGFNQPQFGMGFQGHHMQTSVNAGNLQGMPTGQSNGMQTPASTRNLHGMPNVQSNGMQTQVSTRNLQGMPNGQSNGMQTPVSTRNLQGIPNGQSNGMQTQVSTRNLQGMTNGQSNGMQTPVSTPVTTGNLQGMPNGQSSGMNTSVNAGNLQGMPNGSYNQQNNGLLPPSNMNGNFSVQYQHNQGRTSTCGRRPYRRSGHFSGRGGHQ